VEQLGKLKWRQIAEIERSRRRDGLRNVTYPKTINDELYRMDAHFAHK